MYCPNCGNNIDDLSQRCPFCGQTLKGDEIMGEAVEKESRIIDDDRPDFQHSRQTFYGSEYYDPQQRFIMKDLNGWLKLLFVILSFVNVFLGLIIAVVLITSQNLRYKSFGYKLLILCIILMILSFIFGIFNFLFGIAMMGLRRIIG